MLEKQQCFHLQLESIRFYRRDVLFVSVLLLLFFFHFILFLAFEMIFNRIFKFWDSLTQRVIRGRGDRMNQSGERCFPLPSTAVRAFLGFFRDSLMTVCECVCGLDCLLLRDYYQHVNATVTVMKQCRIKVAFETLGLGIVSKIPSWLTLTWMLL